MLHVAWSVYLCVGHTNVPCNNGWTDRDAVWGLTLVGPRNLVLEGVKIPHKKGQFLGIVLLVEKYVCERTGLFILSNGMAAECSAPESRLIGVMLIIIFIHQIHGRNIRLKWKIRIRIITNTKQWHTQSTQCMTISLQPSHKRYTSINNYIQFCGN